MPRRKNGAAALEDTRGLLAETKRQIEDLRRRRADELRGVANEAELDKLDAEIKRLETLASRHNERSALLEAAAVQAETERRVREKEGLIRRIEKKARDERQVAAEEIRDGIARADAGLRKLLELSRDVQAAWPWQAHELAPCLLSPSAILAAISHELYRQGARPRLFGGMDTKFDDGINFPGGKSPRLELAGLPDRIQPLDVVMAEAGELASKILRSGKSTAAPIAAPVNGTTETTPPNATASLRTAAEI